MGSRPDVDELKRAAAVRALEHLRDGMVVGLGSGTTAEIFLEELGQRVQAGMRVVGVPTSERTVRLARRLGVPLTTLDEQARLDLTIDGADQVHLQTFHLLKGRGGALLREKLVARATDQEIIIADRSKLVDALGGPRPLPVEVVRFGWRQTAAEVEQLGCRVELRLTGEDGAAGDGERFTTDEGHYILDCHFPSIEDPVRLGREIKAIVGVVEHGLFLDLADRIIVADDDGVREHVR